MPVATIINCRDGEEILHVVRRSWLTMFPQFIVVFALLVAPFFFAFPLLSIRPYGSYLLLFMLFLGLFLAVRTLVQWYYTMFVVTSFRVVDVYHRGLFDRQVTDAGFEVIQDVSFRKKGIMNMIFNIGHITIQTPGSNTMIEVRNVEQPEVVLGIINQARRDLRVANPTDPKKRFVKTLEGMDEDDVREVMQVAVEKKRKRAAAEFFSEDGGENNTESER